MAADRVLGPLRRRGVIVLAVYATSIGARELWAFLSCGTVFAGAGYMSGQPAPVPAASPQRERTYITCGMGAAAFGVLSVLRAPARPERCRAADDAHAPFALAIVFLSVVASVLSYLALNRALEVLPVARTAALINFSTVVSVLAGVLLLHEPFGWVSAAASAAILVGIWGVQRFASPAVRIPPRAPNRCPRREWPGRSKRRTRCIM